MTKLFAATAALALLLTGVGATAAPIKESDIRRTGEVTVKVRGRDVTFPLTIERRGGVTFVRGKSSDGRYIVMTNTGLVFGEPCRVRDILSMSTEIRSCLNGL